MALNLGWRLVDNIQKIPVEIRVAEIYEGKDWWIETCRMRDDGKAVKMAFDDWYHTWEIVDRVWKLTQAIDRRGQT